MAMVATYNADFGRGWLVPVVGEAHPVKFTDEELAPGTPAPSAGQLVAVDGLEGIKTIWSVNSGSAGDQADADADNCDGVETSDPGYQ
jgi:hypothetical protein